MHNRPKPLPKSLTKGLILQGADLSYQQLGSSFSRSTEGELHPTSTTADRRPGTPVWWSDHDAVEESAFCCTSLAMRHPSGRRLLQGIGAVERPKKHCRPRIRFGQQHSRQAGHWKCDQQGACSAASRTYRTRCYLACDQCDRHCQRQSSTIPAEWQRKRKELEQRVFTILRRRMPAACGDVLMQRIKYCSNEKAQRCTRD
jgi:hypothetical protein